MNFNPNTFSAAELVIFEHDAQSDPIAPLPEDKTPKYPLDTVRLVARLASQNLPENQKSLVRMMVDGKTKDEIAKELSVSFLDLYYLWRDAYRNVKSALDNLPEIEPNLRHRMLVEVSRIKSRN